MSHSPSYYPFLTTELHWQIVKRVLMLLNIEMKANICVCVAERIQVQPGCGISVFPVLRRLIANKVPRGLNPIKFIDYLSLSYDKSATRHYSTCTPPLLSWQFLRLRSQQTSDLLALRTNGNKPQGGFKVVFIIRFLLTPHSRSLTFQNKQILSDLRAKNKDDKSAP